MIYPTEAMMKNKNKWEINEDGRFVALSDAPLQVVKDIEELNKAEEEANSDPDVIYDL